MTTAPSPDLIKAASYTAAELSRVCWEAGDLSYLLHSAQQDFRDAWASTSRRVFVVNCSRRIGKSWWLCVEFVEKCISDPGSLCRLGAPTAKMCKTIIEPHMKAILADCPPHMKPSYSRQEGVWRYPNGSELHLVGCDNGGHERLRGTDTHLGGLDEAGFTEDLRYIVKDILLPQTITTNGRILLASTPSRTPAHDFTEYCSTAEATGAYIKRTIHDAPHISEAQVQEYMIESGGVQSSTWRREYLAEFVVDEDSAVVPEFGKNEPSVVVSELERPDCFDAYVSMDVGFHDLTVVAFAYYDFLAGNIVVEDELVFKRTTALDIDAAVAEKEVDLWGSRHPPYKRIVDAPQIVVAEINRDGRSWQQSRKDDKEAAINALRMAVPRSLKIHERCTTIRAHLRHGIWNRARTQFARSDSFGHFDGIDAMVYLVRNVNRGRNPFPAVPHGVTEQDHWVSEGQRKGRGEGSAALREVFDHKPRNRKR